MSATALRGVVPPIVTPLDEQGEVDFDSLERLTEHLIGSGVHGLFVLGSTGEVAYLDDGQRAAVTRAVVETVQGRVPVLAGVIDLTARRVQAQVDLVTAAGADAVVATAPIYALNDVAEIDRHFRAIAGRSPVPLYAYDIPARVRTKLDAGMLVQLGLDGVLAGVKDSSGDDVGLRRLVYANRSAGSPLSVLTGHEVVVDGALLLGADGVVPGLGNVDAAGYVRLWNHATAGEWSAAEQEQLRLAKLFEITAQSGGRSGDAAGVGAFKIAMVAQRLIRTATMAAPVLALDDAAAGRVVGLVKESGLLPAGAAL